MATNNILSQNLMPMLRNNSDTLLRTGLGLLSGSTGPEQAKLAAQGFLQGRQQNRTKQYIEQNFPDLAGAVNSGILTPADAFKLAMEQRKPKTPIEINGRLVDPTDYRVLADFSTPQRPQETFQMVAPEEAKSLGLPPGAYQRSSTDGKISTIGSGAGNVNNQLPAEMGARIGLGDQFLQELPQIKNKVRAGVVTGITGRSALMAGVGEPAEIWRRVETGRDALVRNLTGAGMAVSEAQNQAARYQISPLDSIETQISKLEGLERDLIATREGAIAARSGGISSGSQPTGGNRTSTGATWSVVE